MPNNHTNMNESPGTSTVGGIDEYNAYREPMAIPCDVKMVGMGRRERRRCARAGTLGRRGARRVVPCPMWLFTVSPSISSIDRIRMLEQIEALGRQNHIVLPGEWEHGIVAPSSYDRVLLDGREWPVRIRDAGDV